MDVWPYLQILRNKNKPAREKIEVLSKIALCGYPSVIVHLTEFLRSKDPELRNASTHAIIALFAHVRGKKELYESLKDSGLTTSDIESFTKNHSNDVAVQLLAIASMSANGYVREKAVRKLSDIAHERAIPFLLYRLSDWVPIIWLEAEKGLQNYRRVEFLDAFIAHLAIVQSSRSVGRLDPVDSPDAILDFVLNRHRDYALEKFKAQSPKTRLIMATHISNSKDIGRREIRLFTTDKNFLVRLAILHHLDAFDESELERLLGDKSARVRLAVLYALHKRGKLFAIAQNFLADRSAAIRQLARFVLKNEVSDFIPAYSKNLETGVKIQGSLAAVSELGAKACLPFVQSYLLDSRIAIHKAAFSALRNLDPKSAYDHAFENMGSPLAGIRNLCLDFLVRRPTPEVLDRARDFSGSGNHDIRKSMLNFFGKVGGWTVLADLILATLDESQDIRIRAIQCIGTWKRKAVNLFSTPSSDDANRSLRILTLARELHAANPDLETDALHVLDHYLQ